VATPLLASFDRLVRYVTTKHALDTLGMHEQLVGTQTQTKGSERATRELIVRASDKQIAGVCAIA
jgi:hypothetical protein